MQAKELLRAGKLQECLTEVKNLVRREPADAGHRLFLFQVQALLGDWDRAADQLKVAGDLSPKHAFLAAVYGRALAAERERAAVFRGEQLPTVFGEPDRWVAEMVEANRLLGAGQTDASQDLRRAALDAAPATSGTINGQPFQWLADADSRTGPILEAVIEGRYYWVPMSRLRELRIEPPADLRDTIWCPAHFMWANGGESLGLIPARYPGSERSDDPTVVAGRKTDWAEPAEGLTTGLGQRMLATDADDYPLLEVRHVVFNVPAVAAGADDGQAEGKAPAPAESPSAAAGAAPGEG